MSDINVLKNKTHWYSMGINFKKRSGQDCLSFGKSTLPLQGAAMQIFKIRIYSVASVFYFPFAYEGGHSTFQGNKKSDENSSDFESLRSGRDSNPRPRA